MSEGGEVKSSTILQQSALELTPDPSYKVQINCTYRIAASKLSAAPSSLTNSNTSTIKLRSESGDRKTS